MGWRNCSNVTLKKLLTALLGLAVVACVLPMYYNYCSVLINQTDRPYFIKSGTLQFLLTSCRASSDDRSQDGAQTSPSIPVAVPCSSSLLGEVSLASCPECFRARIDQVNVTLHEIVKVDNVSVNQPFLYAQVKSAIVQPLMTHYLIVPDFNCSDVYLLAVQLSLLDRQQQRDTVRSTWGSVAKDQKWPNRTVNAKVKVIFVVAGQLLPNLGKENSGQSVQLPEIIKSEARTHKDIMYINMIDSYPNLTLKVLSAFKWVKDNCPCVKFVLKVDYDTFVNVPLLVDTLLYFENRFQFCIIGHVYTKEMNVRRRGRWAIPRTVYPMNSYPFYASGCGYVLSYSVLSQIVDTAPHLPMLPIEDAFITGVMRRVIGCRMFTFPGMFAHYTERRWRTCLMLEDKKMLGMTKDGSKHQLLWDTFLSGTCPI